MQRARLFPLEPSSRTRGNGQILKHSRFCLNTRKHFFSVRFTKISHRRLWTLHSWEIFRSQRDVVLKNHFWLDCMTYTGVFNLNHSVILCFITVTLSDNLKETYVLFSKWSLNEVNMRVFLFLLSEILYHLNCQHWHSSHLELC